MAYSQEQIDKMTLQEIQSIIDNEDLFTKLKPAERRMLTAAKSRIKNQQNLGEIIDLTPTKEEIKPVVIEQPTKVETSSNNKEEAPKKEVKPETKESKPAPAKEVKKAEPAKEKAESPKPAPKTDKKSGEPILKAAEVQTSAKDDKTLDLISWRDSDYVCEYIKRKAKQLSFKTGQKITQGNVIQLMFDTEIEKYNNSNYVFVAPIGKASDQKTAPLTESTKKAIQTIMEKDYLGWSECIRSLIAGYIVNDSENPMNKGPRE